MVDLLLVVAALGVFWYLSNWYLRSRTFTPVEVSPPTPLIGDRTGGIVGTYLDLKIHRHVKLENGTVFEFEGIAVEAAPGKYYVERSDAAYILVDDQLLYRELKSLT